MQNPVARKIKKLGGPSAVASRLKVNGKSPRPNTVSMWALRGEVPWKWRAAFAELGK